jgi:hypothetical protein
MFEKIFHTASYRRKLPVPFFEVLEQERAALHGGPAKTFSWDFTADQLKDSDGDILEKIRLLFSEEERAQLPNPATKEEIAQWLNKLLHLPDCLYFDKHFPKAGLTKETVAMTGLNLDPSELTRLNRLLLEEAFPAQLKKIHDIHLEKIYRDIHAGEGSAALCFSGGGIRSATFALGIAQGLARRGLLQHFDYLSTVSGGGYIGSWLSSWIHRAGKAGAVFDQLKGGEAQSVTEPEPGPLNHLRKYSNYLTPKLGAFSADTWALVATYLRNLLLNWTVFIPILLALFAVPRVYVSLLHLDPDDWIMALMFVCGFIFLAWAMAYSAMNRPALSEDLKQHGGAWFLRRDQNSFLKWCLAPLCLGALCFTTAWSWFWNGAGGGSEDNLISRFLRFICGTPGDETTESILPKIFNYMLLGAALHVTAWLTAECFLKRWKNTLSRPPQWRQLRWEFLLAVITGAVGGIFLWNIAIRDIRGAFSPAEPSFYLSLFGCFAAPMFIIVFLVAATIFIGVGSNVTSDEDREWWARMGAWLLIAVIGWSAFSSLVLFAPLGLMKLPRVFAALGGLSGLFTLIVGYSSNTSARKNNGEEDGALKNILNKALAFAAPLAIIAIIAGLSLATSWLLVFAARKLGPPESLANFVQLSPTRNFSNVVRETPWWLGLGFFGAAAVVGGVLSRFINVNKFSLHAIYRNRLVRAYLGASNLKRDPNPFTGFDPDDNLAMEELRNPKNSTLPQRPIHIVNMALNLVTGENLAWQQRKAETFTASTLHCGNFRLGYRFTKHYALNRDIAGDEKTGLTFGTAVAISGAAASPNQGYHSSPMVALLMTLFNVRLGWWLGNPGAMGYKTFQHSAPHSPVRHFIKEGLGLTDSTSEYVYLSDGGHFENLGLYEMVLRRCRLIVVSDAGCDPKCNLEDLGNAIRKIRVDLGVKIDIKKFEIFSRNDADATKPIAKCCAIGEIDYTSADGPHAAKGVLVYIKPTLLNDEPRDIYNYARTSLEFPHESTGDQWFSESQFESYRALGARTIDWIFNWAEPHLDSQSRSEMFMEFVRQVRAVTEAGMVPDSDIRKMFLAERRVAMTPTN